MSHRIIFHIDVNSAYLSWEAVHRLQHGDTLDLRTVPSVVGGDPVTRHGIVLTKSIPAKKYDIQTGESIFSAKAKCPELIIAPSTLRRVCVMALIGALKFTLSAELLRSMATICFRKNGSCFVG